MKVAGGFKNVREPTPDGATSKGVVSPCNDARLVRVWRACYAAGNAATAVV
jgi:hypothetical protein